MPNGFRAFKRARPLVEEINTKFFNHARKIVRHRHHHLEIVDVLKTGVLGSQRKKQFGRSVMSATAEMFSSGDTYRELITTLRNSNIDEIINIAVPIVLRDYHPEKIPTKDIEILKQAELSSKDIERILGLAINEEIVDFILRQTERKGLFTILEAAPHDLSLLATRYLANCIQAGLISLGESSEENPLKDTRRRIRKGLKGTEILGRFLQSVGGGILVGADVASGASVASLLSIGGGLVAIGRSITGMKEEGE